MGKKHPLDIFRSSSNGFDAASRERRVMLGRVVASAPRAPASAESALAALPPAVAATRERMLNASPPLTVTPPASAPAAAVTQERLPLGAARPLAPPAIPLLAERKLPEPRPTDVRPLRPVGKPGATPGATTSGATTSGAAPAGAKAAGSTVSGATAAGTAERPLPARINRMLLVCSGVLVGGLALWTVANSFGSPSLKKDAAVAPAGASWRVQAATWPGTPAGHEAALNARKLLMAQGFADVDVLAWPGESAGSFSRFDLAVGRAGSEAELAETSKKLKGLKNWPGPVSQPFKDAHIKVSP